MGLGWAPEEWTAFGDTARRHGISNDLLLTLGLVKESTKGGREPYDAFRGRLIFPIESPAGKVLGFGGRVIGEVEDHVPKYLNSPETPVYQKGRVLYGLGWSRQAIRRAEEALVVEGYMDYASLMANGVENVVAPLGTALTPEQAELIARYAHRACFSTTAIAPASRQPSDRVTNSCAPESRFWSPHSPTARIPTRWFVKAGRRLSAATSKTRWIFVERKIQIMERRDLFRSIPGVRRAIDALLPTVRAASDEVTRGVYIARIAEKTGLPRETIEREVAQAPARDVPVPDAGAPPPHRGGTSRGGLLDAGRLPRPGAQPAPAPSARRILGGARGARGGPGGVPLPAYRAIFEELVHLEGRRDPEGAWLQSFPPEVLPVVELLLGDPEAQNMEAPERFYTDTMRRSSRGPSRSAWRRSSGSSPSRARTRRSSSARRRPGEGDRGDARARHPEALLGACPAVALRTSTGG
jgi:DNA primase